MSNAALILEAQGSPLSHQTREIPKPGPKQLVVQNHAIATNPVDYFQQDAGYMVQSWPIILGSDIAGTVHSTGSDVSQFNKGDRVAGFACGIGTGDMNQGAFQEYSILEEHGAVKLPSKISFEEGTTLPMSVTTAGVALFTPERLNLPRGPVSGSPILLVWGAAASVGTAAVQFGRLLGYTVFATASPRNHDYLKKLGATQVFDYNDKAVIDNIVTAAKSAGKTISVCYAAISFPDAAVLAAKTLAAFGPTASSPAKLGLTLPWPEDQQKPENVDVSMSGAFYAVTTYTDLGAWLFGSLVQKSLENGTYTPSPEVEVVGTGLDALNQALDKQRKGVSGKKLVVTLK